MHLLLSQGLIFLLYLFPKNSFIALKFNGYGVNKTSDFHEANQSVLFTSLLKNVTHETMYAPHVLLCE